MNHQMNGEINDQVNGLSQLNMGYCCINTSLRELGIFTSRTCRLETVKQNGISYLYKLANENIDDLAAIFRWNWKNKIYLYRMSSEMFPFASHPDFCNLYDFDQFSEKLMRLGELAKVYNQTLTFHPGQYNQLSSVRDSVVENSITDINIHAKILDMMGCGKDSVIVLHGGSKQDGKEKSLERFWKNFGRLSESAQNRLVLENCEMVYSIEDLLQVSEKTGIPVVIDYHHHNINPDTIVNEDQLYEITKRVLEVWKQRDITPLFHLSESRKGITTKDSITLRRAHSDYVEELPNVLLRTLQITKINLDIEAKMKERSVLHLYKKYNL
jgi:UV DNA damage endonuclease